ncbi:MAG: rhodanese-like domain-containing protein [Desulfobulbaceae bacterium]|nr:rhodanese-like domain-containing protein [Desulfobulbaceae bacterium]
MMDSQKALKLNSRHRNISKLHRRRRLHVFSGNHQKTMFAQGGDNSLKKPGADQPPMVTLPHSASIHKRASLILLICFFLVISGSSVLPAHAEGFQYITAPEVKNMIENNPNVVIINALSKIEYNGLHIPGSINIPIIDFKASKDLPKDKKTPLITYCMGRS